MKHSTTPTIISALKILARDIQSNDGVANATILEAAQRLEMYRSHSRLIIEATEAQKELWMGCSKWFQQQDIIRNLIAQLADFENSILESKKS
jgi:hypothetical protein